MNNIKPEECTVARKSNGNTRVMSVQLSHINETRKEAQFKPSLFL